MSGIYGNPGQTNYGAAKAGIAAFTNIVALEVARYGVTVNAVGPVALTRMTEGLGPAPETDEEREARGAALDRPDRHLAGSEEAAGVTGRVFEASGQVLAVAEGWVRGPSTDPDRRPDHSSARSSPSCSPRPAPNSRHGRPHRLLAADRTPDTSVNATACARPTTRPTASQSSP